MEVSVQTKQAIAAAHAQTVLRRQHLVAAGMVAAIVAGVGLIVLGGWFLFRKPALARLNADTATLARFVATDTYLNLPLERQDPYMKVLKEREDSLDLQKSFTEGRITEDEYRNARQEAWYWQQIKRSEKWAALPTPEAKVAYLNELIGKKEKDIHPGSALPDVPKPDKAAGALDKAPKAGKGKKIKAPKTDDSLGIKRDDSFERIRINRWPKESRDRWIAFHRAYKDQKKVYDAAIAVKAATAATRPADGAGK
ncbi:MAG: hypothetical protein ABSH20_02560 [Tepidisphaeraceae bacterium]|jgi:hypothetical protein